MDDNYKYLLFQACGQFIVTPEVMTKAKKRMVVMHPLPRNFEIRYVYKVEITLKCLFIIERSPT
jgi:aspartate carbamoyltransferase catalytic subunit